MDDLLPNETIQQCEAALEDLRDCSLAAPDDNIAHVKQLQDLCGKLLEQMETQRQETQAAVEQLSQRFAPLQALLSSESEASAGWRDKEAAWQAAETSLKGEISSLQDELAQRNSLLEEQQRAGEDASGKVKALESSIAETSRLAAEREERIKQLEQDLKKAVASGADQEKLAARGTELETKCAELQAKVTDLEGVAEAARQARADLDELLKKAQAEVQSLKAQAQEAAARAEEQDALRKRLVEMEKLQPALQEERKQRMAAEQRLHEEMARGTKSMLAQQLAEALREAEEAKEELRRLRGSGADPALAALGMDDEMPEPEDAVAAPAAAKPAPDQATMARQEALIGAYLKDVRPGQKRSIGELLVEAGVLNEDQLEQALEQQKIDPHHHLGAILINRGWVSEESVARVLASQVNVPYVDLAQSEIQPGAIGILSGRLACQHICVPIRSTDDRVTVAMVNPMDLVAIEDLERATGRGVDVVVSTNSQIQTMLDYYYGEAIA